MCITDSSISHLHFLSRAPAPSLNRPASASLLSLRDKDLEATPRVKAIIKNLNEKINKLYNWHLVEIDLVSRQQMQLNEMKSEINTTKATVATVSSIVTQPTLFSSNSQLGLSAVGALGAAAPMGPAGPVASGLQQPSTPLAASMLGAPPQLGGGLASTASLGAVGVNGASDAPPVGSPISRADLDRALSSVLNPPQQLQQSLFAPNQQMMNGNMGMNPALMQSGPIALNQQQQQQQPTNSSQPLSSSAPGAGGGQDSALVRQALQSLSMLDPTNPAHAEEIAIIQSLMADLPPAGTSLPTIAANSASATPAQPTADSSQPTPASETPSVGMSTHNIVNPHVIFKYDHLPNATSA